MLLVGYAFAIRSERRLCKAAHLMRKNAYYSRLNITI